VRGNEREGTRTDRRRRRPSCAVDCTTKGAIMRPFSNHRAFCPPFDPSGFPPPVVLRRPFPQAPNPDTSQPDFVPREIYRSVSGGGEGYRVFLFKCTPSTCRRAPANLNAIRGRRCDLTRCTAVSATLRRNLLMSDCRASEMKSEMKSVPD